MRFFLLEQLILLFITLRFLVGVFNGIIGTTKAILGDVSDDSNQAVGLALLSVGWVRTVSRKAFGMMPCTVNTKRIAFCRLIS